MREKFFVLPPLIHQHRFPCISSPHSVFSHLRRQRRVVTNAQTKWMAKSPINQAIQAQAGLSAKIYCLDLIGPDSRSSIGNPDICTLICSLRYCACTVILTHSSANVTARSVVHRSRLSDLVYQLIDPRNRMCMVDVIEGMHHCDKKMTMVEKKHVCR